MNHSTLTADLVVAKLQLLKVEKMPQFRRDLPWGRQRQSRGKRSLKGATTLALEHFSRNGAPQLYPTALSPTRVTLKLVFVETQGGERRQALETGRNRTCFGMTSRPACGSTGWSPSLVFVGRRARQIDQFRSGRGKTRSANCSMRHRRLAIQTCRGLVGRIGLLTRRDGSGM